MEQILCTTKKSNPITGLYRPLGGQEVEAPRFLDNRHIKVVRLSALHTGRLYPPGNIPGTDFRYRLSRPQDHSAAERIMSMKSTSDIIGNRTRDLPVCSAVPQQTAPPRVPCVQTIHSKNCWSSREFPWIICYPNVHNSVDNRPLLVIILVQNNLLHSHSYCFFMDSDTVLRFTLPDGACLLDCPTRTLNTLLYHLCYTSAHPILRICLP
jgi:hypothetical protein